MKTIKKCFVVCLSTFGLTACGGGLEPLESEIEGYGFAFNNPPRTDHGPGWTFVFAKTSDGRTVPLTVCTDILPDVEPHIGKLSMAKLKTQTKVGLDIGIDLIADQLVTPADAKANFDNNDTVSIDWSKVRSLEYSVSDRFKPDGSVRSIDPACAAALKVQQARGEIDDNIFVVMGVLEVEELTYSFSSVRGAKLSGAVDLKKLVSFKPTVTWERKNDTSLVIKSPRYVGYNAVKITDFADTGLLGTAMMRIAAEPVTLETLRGLAE